LDCFAPKMKALRWLKTSLTSKPHSAPRDIPAHLNLQQDRCESRKSRSFCYFVSPYDVTELNAKELRPPVGLLHHSQRIGMEHWWNDSWRVKIEVKSSKSQKNCLTCHFSHNNSPMDCSGIEGGPPQWKRTPESLWCSPIRNYSNFWSACTVLSAIERRGVSDVSTKFISSVTLGDPSFISHRASGPAALCRPISWESAVPFFIAITRRSSGLRISCALF
jgi:hypothetical protein